VRIVPKTNHYVVEVVYEAPSDPNSPLDPNLVAGLDLGLNNLAALTSNKPGFQPLLVNGRPLKAINQWYNRRRSKLQAQLPAGRHTSRQLDIITDKRNRQITAYLHLTSRRIIDRMVGECIGTLVIGKNDGWKQHANLGARTNQNFVFIPHARLIEMLRYKGEQVGICVITHEESYTSKCSFLDLEPHGKHERYTGKRIHRGLFRSASGVLINADVNAAYNHIRKVRPNAFADGIAGVVVHPVRLPLGGCPPKPKTRSTVR
jgi:putative transposase